MPNGQGIFFAGPGPQQGMTLKGIFKNGKPEGEVKYSVVKSGNERKLEFAGQFVGGIRQGHGKEINEKGDIYEGGFNRDKKEGKGK